MLYYLKSKLRLILPVKSERSDKILKNVIQSFGIKGGSILVGLLLIPMTIDYINPIQYGIWLTVSSIITWMNFFDIGIGNGLRNKLAEALALNEFEKARKYISTTYAILLVVTILLLALLWFIIPNIDWNRVLNIKADAYNNLHVIVLIVASAFCFQFVFQIINVILFANQYSAIVSIINFIGQATLLAGVYFLKQFVPSNFPMLVSILAYVPIIVMLFASIYLFKTKLSAMLPSIKSIDLKYARDLFNLGGSFFIIQVGAMLLFQTDNIIISQILGPEAVTEFNISYKLFSIVTMVFVIIVTPYWSAFTDAYAKNDLNWIKKNIKLLRKVWLIMSGVAVILLIFSDKIINIWVGPLFTINDSFNIAMVLYCICYLWQTLHVFLLNGIGKIRLQLIAVTISATINIPLAIFLGKNWGLVGIISANTIVFLVMGIIFYYQVEKIISTKATGIWIR